MTAEKFYLTKFLGITSKDMLEYEKKHVTLSTPRLMGLYDIDFDTFSPTNKIRYHFKMPHLSAYPLDLNKEQDSFVTLKRTTEVNLFRPMLHAISYGAESTFDDDDDGGSDCNSDTVERTSVYTRRGILKNIMAFCYGKFNFDALVSRYNGKIYMIEQELSEDEFGRNQGAAAHHCRLCQLVFVDTFDGTGDDGKSSNNDNIFQISVHKSTLGKYNLHYVARAQGIIANEVSEKTTDINALNKSRFVAAKQMWSGLRNKDLKLLKYWPQAYLSNVSVLYLGYKDINAMVRTPIECLKVGDIPKTCSWKPDICTTFLHEFLEKVERLMSNVDSLHTVYKFRFNAEDKTICYIKYEGKTKLSFIPEDMHIDN